MNLLSKEPLESSAIRRVVEGRLDLAESLGVEGVVVEEDEEDVLPR